MSDQFKVLGAVSTAMRVEWRDRIFINRQAIVPDGNTASHLVNALLMSNEVMEDSIKTTDAQTGIVVKRMTTCEDPEDTAVELPEGEER